MAARTRRIRHDDRTRERLRAAYLINRLQGHAEWRGLFDEHPGQGRPKSCCASVCRTSFRPGRQRHGASICDRPPAGYGTTIAPGSAFGPLI